MNSVVIGDFERYKNRLTTQSDIELELKHTKDLLTQAIQAGRRMYGELSVCIKALSDIATISESAESAITISTTALKRIKAEV